MTLLVISLPSGVAPLSRVVSVLHARAVAVTGMTYAVRPQDTRLLLDVNGSHDQVGRLAHQIERVVDVLQVSIGP